MQSLTRCCFIEDVIWLVVESSKIDIQQSIGVRDWWLHWTHWAREHVSVAQLLLLLLPVVVSSRRRCDGGLGRISVCGLAALASCIWLCLLLELGLFLGWYGFPFCLEGTLHLIDTFDEGFEDICFGTSFLGHGICARYSRQQSHADPDRLFWGFVVP